MRRSHAHGGALTLLNVPGGRMTTNASARSAGRASRRSRVTLVPDGRDAGARPAGRHAVEEESRLTSLRPSAVVALTCRTHRLRPAAFLTKIGTGGPQPEPPFGSANSRKCLTSQQRPVPLIFSRSMAPGVHGSSGGTGSLKQTFTANLHLLRKKKGEEAASQRPPTPRMSPKPNWTRHSNGVPCARPGDTASATA